MRFLVLPLALLLGVVPAAAQMRSEPARIPARPLSINGTGQAGLVDRRQYVVRPYMIVRSDEWRGELRQIDRRIRRARDNGEMTRGQARALRHQAEMIRSLGDAYAAGGYSAAELYVLNSQTFALRDLAQTPNRPVPPPRGR